MPAQHESPQTTHALLQAAAPLLAYCARLQLADPGPDLAALKKRLLTMVVAFRVATSRVGLPSDTLNRAQYWLCHCLDECLAASTWGREHWRPSGLLMDFYQEAEGQARCDEEWARLQQAPDTSQDTLAFISLLQAFRQRAAQAGPNDEAPPQSRTPPINMSPQWQPANYQLLAPPRQATGASRVLTGLLIGVVFCLLFLIFDFNLAQLAQRTLISYRNINPQPMQLILPAGTPTQSLSQQFATELAQHQLQLTLTEGALIISLNPQQLFMPHSASLQPAQQALMIKIARALSALPGDITITDHEVRQPADRSSRDAWLRSALRARTIEALLALYTKDPQRLHTMPSASTGQHARHPRRSRLTLRIASSRSRL